jgi:hypothetical protein
MMSSLEESRRFGTHAEATKRNQAVARHGLISGGKTRPIKRRAFELV